MDNIYNIKYIDAYYVDRNDSFDELKESKLHLHEVYGYLEKNKSNIIITFIKEVCEDSCKNNEFVKGIIIPDTAIYSVSLETNLDIAKNFSIGSNIKVEWRDIVFVSNQKRNDCSIMNTQGILYKVEKDHLVIKEPQTLRSYPEPKKKHPDDSDPAFYVIPKAFINSIKNN